MEEIIKWLLSSGGVALVIFIANYIRVKNKEVDDLKLNQSNLQLKLEFLEEKFHDINSTYSQKLDLIYNSVRDKNE